MRRRLLLDTGPLVAYLKRQDEFHNWVMGELARIEPPLLTCEPVIVEACFLVRNVYPGSGAVISLLNRGLLQIAFDLQAEAGPIEQLMNRYQSVPMSCADACLVRMAELSPGSEMLTLDSDFLIYRKNRNQTIPVIMPQNE
ncbi:MAG: PIN domain-containing protein [Hormoscilla sp. GUM202]|nr:PIN domain-containing protein [Hormoscilla sp. GUM202]